MAAERVSHNGVVGGDRKVCVSGARIFDSLHSDLYLHYGRLAISFGAPDPVQFLPLLRCD